MSKKLNVLFLCTGNSCRSQMAEGWAHHLKSDIINAYSAGIEPKGLNPYAVDVMAEAGIDISQYKSKHIDDLENILWDVVITVCDNAQENCPYFPGNFKRIHKGFDDPPQIAKELAKKGANPEEQIGVYRRVRDEIRSFIENMPEIFYKG